MLGALNPPPNWWQRLADVAVRNGEQLPSTSAGTGDAANIYGTSTEDTSNTHRSGEHIMPAGVAEWEMPYCKDLLVMLFDHIVRAVLFPGKDL